MSNDKKLISAYMDLMTEVHVACKRKHDESLPAIDEAIERLSLDRVKKQILSSEDAEKVAFYLRRDLHDMAQFLEDYEDAEPDNWLAFDLKLLESKTWETFLSIADRTRVELDTFNQRLENPGEYAAGEITGFGTLECAACGNRLHFYKADIIPHCSECASTGYIRIKD